MLKKIKAKPCVFKVGSIYSLKNDVYYKNKLYRKGTPIKIDSYKDMWYLRVKDCENNKFCITRRNLNEKEIKNYPTNKEIRLNNIILFLFKHRAFICILFEIIGFASLNLYFYNSLTYEFQNGTKLFIYTLLLVVAFLPFILGLILPLLIETYTNPLFKKNNLKALEKMIKKG